MISALVAGGSAAANALTGLVDTGINTWQRYEDRKFNSAEAQKQRTFTSAEAQKQRDWETEMSNSAHQREVADLKAAGLNPILSVTGGNGSSTPGGSIPSSSAASINSGKVSNLSSIVNSAADLVKAFNFDRNRDNDINPNQAYKLVNGLSSAKSYNKLYADMDNVTV